MAELIWTERAIASLGDIRGETDVARRVYLEACLIDPEVIDWNHLRDNSLRELHTELADEEGCGGFLPGRSEGHRPVR